MKPGASPRKVINAALAGVLLFGATNLYQTPQCAYAAERAVVPEKNPPGDIPDTQVFIDYASKSGFSIKVPEGWARTEMSDGASFADKLDGVVVTITQEATSPTVASVEAHYLPKMKQGLRAVKFEAVEAVDLPSGRAIRIIYTSNSEPNAVTNKQVRLENNRYLFYRKGKLVALELYAPQGADNVDQWQLMSRSFRWN